MKVQMHCVFAKCIPVTFLHDLVLSRKHLAHFRGILGSYESEIEPVFRIE
jgi:hypothetical protein